MSDFVVYRIFGKKSGEAYYGYCTGETPMESFLKGATRGDAASADRGDVRLYAANGESVDNLTAEVLDVCIDEMEAFLRRNEERANHSDSITGPTMFPGGIAERAAKERPGRMSEVARIMKMRAAKTARQAWQLGMWSNDAIKALSARFKRDEIVADLDKLNPTAFDLKYRPGVAV